MHLKRKCRYIFVLGEQDEKIKEGNMNILAHFPLEEIYCIALFGINMKLRF